MQLLFQPEAADSPFVWAVGIENTFIPQTRPGQRALDEYALMGHDRLWRADLDRIASLGVRAVRYGIPWHRVNPSPGRFDWSWTDEVLPHLVTTLGLTPIIDLVHYGTPLWLTGEFLAVDYPARVAEYAGAFAERYASLINHFTPLNEPAVTAMRSGFAGVWPPYRRGIRGYVAVLVAAARGMIATAQAIEAVQPNAVFVHTEDVGHEFAATVELAPWVAERQARRFLPLDLACGRVRPDHPLWNWLVAGGAAEATLGELAAQAISWTVLGVNFYPWSNRRWQRRSDGTIGVGRDRSNPAAALTEVLRTVHERYQVPVMVTETSASGTMARRLAWLKDATLGVARARAGGVPVVGLTWFPVFTMIDWRYRRSRRPVDQHLLHLGLWDVPDLKADCRREATTLVAAFRTFASRTPESSCAAGECHPE